MLREGLRGGGVDAAEPEGHQAGIPGLTEGVDLSDPLLSRQFSLEALMLDSGAAAYRSRVAKSREKGRGSNDGGAKKLLTMAVAPLAAAVRSLVAHAASGAPGKRNIAVKKLETLNAETVAFLTIAEVLNGTLRRGHAFLSVQLAAIN